MEQKPAGFQKIFSERTQRLIDMSKNQFVRRSSDASISGKNGSGNEFNNFASTSSSTVSRKDNRRRLQFRKRRLDCRRSVEVKDLGMLFFLILFVPSNFFARRRFSSCRQRNRTKVRCRRSLQRFNLKQTSRRCIPIVSCLTTTIFYSTNLERLR